MIFYFHVTIYISYTYLLTGHYLKGLMVLVNIVPHVSGIGTSLNYSHQFFIVICFLISIHFLNAKLAAATLFN